MENSFSAFLRDQLDTSNVTRIDFINSISQKERAFYQLDQVTLSRWILGRTKPSLFKQFLIAKHLGVDILNFILEIDFSVNKDDSNIERITSKIKESQSKIPYYSLSGNYIYKFSRTRVDEHISELSSYYKNVSIERIIAKKKDLSKYCNVMKVTDEDGVLVSHWFEMTDLIKLRLKPLSKRSGNELSESVIGIFSGHDNIDYFWATITHILTHQIQNNPNKRWLYMYTTGVNNTKMLQIALKGDMVFSTLASKALPIYLLKIDLLQALGNQSLLKKVKDKLICIQQCSFKKDCTDCNMKSFQAQIGL